jgi:thymidylate synthase
MNNYINLLRKTMTYGDDREGRNGMARAIFAEQCRWLMEDGFPAVTTKQLFFKLVKSELLWFLKGTRSILDLRMLVGSDRTIWDHDLNKESWQRNVYCRGPGDVGRIYGVQWRHWQGKGGESVDQITRLIAGLRDNPASRYHVVTAWNPIELDQVCLAPCHMGFQCFVAGKNLSLHMVQRSCDLFLGVPFNIASYALLLHMLAQVTGLRAHELVITFNDCHIYHAHFDAVKEQMERAPMPLPKLALNPEVKDIDKFTMEDIKLLHYKHHPPIRAEIQ